jgi:membrane protein implicated in regulation of membrane protease activity
MRDLFLMLLPAGILTMFAADANTLPIEIPYGQWVQGGAAAVVSGLLIYIIVRYLPQLQREQRAAVAELQAGFNATLDRMAERFERWETLRDNRDDQLNSTLQSLIANCARFNDTARKA